MKYWSKWRKRLIMRRNYRRLKAQMASLREMEQAAIRAEEQGVLAKDETIEQDVAAGGSEGGRIIPHQVRSTPGEDDEPETASVSSTAVWVELPRIKWQKKFEALGGVLVFPFKLLRSALSLAWAFASLAAGYLPALAGIALIVTFWIFLGAEMDVDRTIEILTGFARPVIDVFRPTTWSH